MEGLDILSATATPKGPARRRAWLLPLASILLLGVLVGGSALLYRRSLENPRTIPGIRVGATVLPALDAAAIDGQLAEEAERFEETAIRLFVGSSSLTVKRHQLGARVNLADTRARLLATGKTGDFLRDLVDRVQARRGKLVVPLAAALDRDAALEFFTRLKAEVDRPPVQARLDLDRGVVVPAVEGRELRVYDCLAATELALGRHQSTVRLAVTDRAAGSGERLKSIDIGHVLGTFTTVYSLADKDADRAHNLKVGASKLDGTILDPGATFSFNGVVGRRTEKEGYRTAPVITEGELVDGMAGGACQLSSTLFAASFFAGLELVSSRPHTRPSSYIKMGLDAAVAYPGTDLVLKNSYPFPVVIHYKVNQGKVTVRLLGRERPYRKVVFERVIKETIPFKTVVKPSPSIPKGNRVVAQVGVPGFRTERRRLFYGKGADPEKTEKREVNYPPTTELILEGSGPKDPAWKPPTKPAPFGDAPPEFKMSQ
jgi:vancomycin resistance protein YoaR